jgi:hypothetical protein
LHVLTFNSHQPYIHLLASSLPWTFGVILPHLPSGATRGWDDRVRPIPENVRFYRSTEEARESQLWDWVMTHNVHDLLDCRDIALPKVFVVHGTLRGRLLEEKSRLEPDLYLSHFRALLDTMGCRLVYISALKLRDWRIPGTVIVSAVDPAEYGPYRGDKAVILRVCNHLRERGAILGSDAHEEVCGGLPSLVMGTNQGLANSRLPASWEDLKEEYRSCRVYLSTAIYPYEDGYNLAVLEAMASGMPIAALSHPTLPVQDGIEGVVASTPSALRERIIRLLENPTEAHRLGEAARERVKRDFSLPVFKRKWISLAAEAQPSAV